jgi:hypothetical protein
MEEGRPLAEGAEARREEKKKASRRGRGGRKAAPSTVTDMEKSDIKYDIVKYVS